MSFKFEKPVNTIISGISRLLSISTRRPAITIAIITVGTVIFGFLSSTLVVNNDYDTWLPEGDPLTVLYKEVNETFSAAAVVLVALDLGDVFTEEGIAKIGKVTGLIEEIPEIFSVMSLTNVIDFRQEDGTLEVARLGDRIEHTPEGLREFREYVLGRELYAGTFVSLDGRYANIIVNIRDDAEEVDVSKQMKALLQKELPGEQLYLGGDPVYTVYIDEFSNEDIATTGPIALILMVAVLLFGFRSFWGMVLPLSLAGVAIVWMAGIKALIGWPWNVMNTAVVVLIFAMGSDYAVHVLNRFRSRESGTEPSLEIAPPVVISALTTIVGLLTFATTDISVLKWFGAEIAIGLGISMFLSLTLLPAVMHAFGSKLARKWQAPKPGPDRFSRVVSRLGAWGIRYRWFILLFLLIGMLAAGFGITRINTSSNYLEMLPEDSVPRQASYLFRDHFVGSYSQTLYVKGDLANPALLKAMIRAENYHRSIPEFSGYSSIASLIAEEHYLINGTYSIPDTREGVASLWLLLEGDPMLRNLVTPDRTRGIVNAYTGLEDGADMKQVSQAVDTFLEQETDDTLISIHRQKLPPGLDEKITHVLSRRVAREFSWLASYYSDFTTGDDLAEKLEGHIAEHHAIALTVKDIEELADQAERYTEEELFITDPNVKDEIRLSVTRVLNLWKERNIWAEAVLPDLYASINRVPLDERTQIIRDLAAWMEGETLRLRVARMAEGLDELIPGDLGPHFEKRAAGVLADLYSPLPAFFARELEALSIPSEAVISEADFYIRQMGVPSFFAIFDNLLHRSQVNSLSLATVFVFFMIWLGLQIVRGSLFALASVLASIVFILGFMGFTRIPLDYGTVLTGPLIIGLGVDGVIHIIYHLRRSRGQGSGILETLSEIGKAITTANFTTSAGLLALGFSKISAVANFGLVNGMAILIVTFLNLILVPLLIVIFPINQEKGKRKENREVTGSE